MSFLEMLDVLNERLIEEGHEPIAFDSDCREGICGTCGIMINGQAHGPEKGTATCQLHMRKFHDGDEITLEPWRAAGFPVMRDLIVDRSRMFEDLKHVKAWIHLDGSHELGPGPRQAPENQEEAYPLSRCMTCGCCLEVCPQISGGSNFIGPAAINQVRLFNLHPSGKMHAGERLEALMEPGGIGDCGKAQNCVEVCPKEIPLVDSIAVVSRQTTKHMLFGWLLK